MIPDGCSDINLFDSLVKLFKGLAKNSGKFSVGLSSNANESLNASMASKAHKSKFLSSTDSANIRWSSSVCSNNVGSV